MNRNVCTIDNCGTQIRPLILMCNPHWRNVPITIRDDITRTQRAWRESGIDLPPPDYVTARQVAIDFIHRRKEL